MSNDKQNGRPIVWLIGGLDPSGGAGLIADARMAQALGCHPICIPSCNTVQNHSSCHSVHAIDLDILKPQMQLLLDMAKPDAIKLGLVPTLEMLNFLANVCSSLDVPVIVDPVFKTSSGFETARKELVEGYKTKLIPRAHVVTPNLDEAMELLGDNASKSTPDQIAKALKGLGAKTIVLKGGHDSSQPYLVTDRIETAESSYQLETDRLPGQFRGTGCALATAIACKMAKGFEPNEAIVIAKSYLTSAMQNAYSQGDYQILNPKSSAQALPRLTTSTFPRITSLADLSLSPSTGKDPLGLYPILPDYEWIERLCETGITTVQLRIKGLSQEQVKDQIAKSVALCSVHGIRLFVNDYWREAIAAGAYGVHLGQEDLDTADISEIKKAGLRLGISTHSVFELARALSLKPSYVALGPIFETTCKSMSFGPQGFDRINEWMALSDCPVVAIGGLTLDHTAKLRDIGADGVAVLSNITASETPERQVKTWLKELGYTKQVL